jgi:hypothetical protein
MDILRAKGAVDAKSTHSPAKVTGAAKEPTHSPAKETETAKEETHRDAESIKQTKAEAVEISKPKSKVELSVNSQSPETTADSTANPYAAPSAQPAANPSNSSATIMVPIEKTGKKKSKWAELHEN